MSYLRGFRTAIKRLLSGTLYYTGLTVLLLRPRLASQGLVLMYHRVLPVQDSEKSSSSESIVVTPATFARHLKALQRHFTFVTPAEFEEWWQGRRSFPKAPCLITFDDGWKDNSVHAHPILRAAGAPAVIFLPTEYIGSQRTFWQERLTGMLENLGRHPRLASHPLVKNLGLHGIFQNNDTIRAKQARDTARNFKSYTPEEINSIVSDVTDLVHTEIGPVEPSTIDAHLNWHEVQTMQADNVHFGSHAITHRILTRLDGRETQTELCESRRILEQKLGTGVHTLAYPNGDHDSETCRLAQECGYHMAFTTVPGWVKQGDDPYRLRRINIHEGAHRHVHALYASILGVF